VYTFANMRSNVQLLRHVVDSVSDVL